MSEKTPKVGTDLVGLGIIGVQLIQSGEKFLEKLVGPYLEERGELWADRVRIKRQNLLTVAGLASQQIGDRSLHPVPGRVLFPTLEAAANEEDPTLQAMWASLLAHAVTEPDSVLPAFPNILRDLSPFEVKMLNSMCTLEHGEGPTRSLKTESVSLEQMTANFNSTPDQILPLCANLYRLGLIMMTYNPGSLPQAAIEARFIHITIAPFGDAFIMACTSKST